MEDIIKKELRDLFIKLLILNYKKKFFSGFFKNNPPIFFIDELKKEIKELEDSIKNNNVEEITEEIGDVLNDCLLLFFKICDYYRIDPSLVLRKIVDKVSLRAPFLIFNYTIDEESELKFWTLVKILEKNEKIFKFLM